MGFIAVHLGIGSLSMKWSQEGKNLIEKACNSAIEELRYSDCPRLAVVKAISVLENSSLTNAGYGSNLNQNGDVECDASLMDGESGLYGSVGAVQEVSNPIAVAYNLLEQQKIPRPLGLLPPDFLTGEGARTYAMDNGHTMRNLRSSKSIKRYRKYKKLLKASHARVPEENGDEIDEENEEDILMLGNEEQEKQKEIEELEEDGEGIEVSVVTESFADFVNKRRRLDTVGAIAVNSKGQIAVGSSSGGISLKYPGRVGSAARIGAGCWAEPAVGVTATGNGEYIARAFLSREASKELFNWRNTESSESFESSYSSCIERIFVNNRLMNTIQRDDLVAGYIGVKVKPEDSVIDFVCDIYGGNIFIGYQSTSTHLKTEFLTTLDRKPTFFHCPINA